jgi:hypothetical protein
VTHHQRLKVPNRRPYAVALLLLAPVDNLVAAQACGSCAGATVQGAGRAEYALTPVEVPRAAASAKPQRKPRGRVTYTLVAGDVLEEDESGHVAAVRHATSPPTWTRFAPGAVSPPGKDVVVGVIAGP